MTFVAVWHFREQTFLPGSIRNAVLLAAGTAGKRYSLSNSRMMVHQPLGGAQGQASDIEIQANEILRIKDSLNKILSVHTGQKIKKIASDTDRDFFMTAKEAKDYGLIDRVVVDRKELEDNTDSSKE